MGAWPGPTPTDSGRRAATINVDKTLVSYSKLGPQERQVATIAAPSAPSSTLPLDAVTNPPCRSTAASPRTLWSQGSARHQAPLNHIGDEHPYPPRRRGPITTQKTSPHNDPVDEHPYVPLVGPTCRPSCAALAASVQSRPQVHGVRHRLPPPTRRQGTAITAAGTGAGWRRAARGGVARRGTAGGAAGRSCQPPRGRATSPPHGRRPPAAPPADARADDRPEPLLPRRTGAGRRGNPAGRSAGQTRRGGLREANASHE